MRFYYFLRNLHLEHINTLSGKQLQLSALQCAHIGQYNKSATIEHTYTKKVCSTIIEQTSYYRYRYLQRQITHRRLHKVVIAIGQWHVQLSISWQVTNAVLENKMTILAKRRKILLRAE